MKVLTAAQTAQLEQACAEAGMASIRLMENAGTAAARILRKRWGAQDKNVAVLCGRGNNGGDGFVLARRLFQEGARVTVVLPLGTPATADAAEMLVRATSLGIPAVEWSAASAKAALQQADVVVDGLFGTGFHGRPDEAVASLIELVNRSGKPVLSLDLPSGAACDSARVEGACFRAAVTVAFHTLKPAHVVYPAAEYAGDVTVADVGAPEELLQALPDGMQTVEPDYAASLLPARPVNSHKGTFGHLAAVCGRVGMAGAAVLAARGASACGVGLVEVCAPQSLLPVLGAHLVEQILCPLPETAEGMTAEAAVGRLEQVCSRATACLCGCGLGVSADTVALVRWLLTQQRLPVVLDADGINCLARHIDDLDAAAVPVVLTPHPGEMARLLGCSAHEVQQNRVEIARQFAVDHRVTLVLKGAGTLIAAPDGRLFINRTGNAGMAKGGSGDLLAGMIASLLAQGVPADQAAVAGVYFHGLAGDRTAAVRSARAMQPGDMLAELGRVFLELEQGS